MDGFHFNNITISVFYRHLYVCYIDKSINVDEADLETVSTNGNVSCRPTAVKISKNDHPMHFEDALQMTRKCPRLQILCIWFFFNNQNFDRLRKVQLLPDRNQRNCTHLRIAGDAGHQLCDSRVRVWHGADHNGQGNSERDRVRR